MHLPTLSKPMRAPADLGLAAMATLPRQPRRWAQWLACGVVLASLPCLALAGSSEVEAVHVLQRLAYGPAPGDVARVMAMGVDAYIDAQLHPQTLPMPLTLQARLDALGTLSGSQSELVQRFREATAQAKAQRSADSEANMAQRKALQQQLRTEAAQARLWRAVASPRQLEEVMVDFWFNHFNVFEGKGLDHALVASYEREAIRPWALGRFRDLLGATAHHPAMLFYLDNWLSQGQGPKGGKGLNENFARELMELHTLGVDGGYTQNDVTELARILTGWTLAPEQPLQPLPPRRARQLAEWRDASQRTSRPALPSGSAFLFDPGRHDPGDKVWLGRTVGGQGQAEGEWALDVLAAHPATARHIALQLAQQFVSEQPPPELVQALARRFTETDGDIRAVLDTLFHSPAFRDPAIRGRLFKTPYRYVVSSVRATGWPLDDVRPVMGALQQLGMPLYGRQTPDGYPLDAATWLSPDALTRRLQLATAWASGKPFKAPPVDDGALLATWGAAVSPATRAKVVHAEPAMRAAMVLGSPDAMWH